MSHLCFADLDPIARKATLPRAQRWPRKQDFKLRMADRTLPPEFFNRGAEGVALALLGNGLARRRGKRLSCYKITETEAYVGPHDLACHAARGRTKRTEVMYGPPGSLYVYLVYGMHWMLNVVTGEVGYPAAVLIRGIEAIRGPGRLTKTLGITGSLNGASASEVAGLWFVDRGEPPSLAQIIRTPRIGVGYAGPLWAAKKFRFILDERQTRAEFP